MAYVVRSHESYDVVKFHLLYVAIPTNREINLTAMMSDAGGITWSKDVRMLDAPNEPEVAVRSQRLVTLHSDCGTEWAPYVIRRGSIPRSLLRLFDRFDAHPPLLTAGFFIETAPGSEARWALELRCLEVRRYAAYQA